ncbi:unnamed protein product [Penicillium egyptiacum]|uniref:F-box domain-containing protein n=1 Tax=Penicillium egyptiacum TaxID=1303716 RepID=A0A9W4K673_9EURO|nr:unnamed protein product [Penicillium egyptiacum]
MIYSLSTEILLTILECLSPLDLLSASRALPILYRTFVAYKQHLLGHTLRQAIHPACAADVYTALDAQNIPRLVKSGESIAKAKAECFSLFTTDRTRRRQNIEQFIVDNANLDTLFYLHVNIERLIDSYCHWSLGNLTSHHEKPTPFQTTTVHPRANLSSTEQARLQRAFYRCEIYARFQRILHLLIDKSAALNFSQIVLSFVSQFTLYEFEEIISVQHFLAQFIRSLCERVEDDFMASYSLAGSGDVGVEKEASGNAVSTKNQGLGDLSFFTKSYRDIHHSGHVKFLVSCGLSYILRLSLMEPQALKQAMLKSDMESRKNTVTDFFSQGGLDIGSCEEKEQNIVLRGKLVSIPRDEVGSCNLGWKWGTSFHDFVKPDSPAMFDLRNQGYVFWDQERLQVSGLVNEPNVVCAGVNYFPPGHRGPFLRPSVEERLGGLWVDSGASRKVKDE